MENSASYKKGLSYDEAKYLLTKYGFNEILEEKISFFQILFEKLWGPIPWILEAALVLEVLFGKISEPIIIAVLLLFSAIFGGVQKLRAQKALSFLRSRLQITSHVCRSGIWQFLPARELVPGDIIRLKIGDFVPADCLVYEGVVEVDQSALTGESTTATRSEGDTMYSGAIVRSGDAIGMVTATGSRSYYGKTAELLRTAHPVSHLEKLLFTIVRYLLIIDAVFAVILIVAVLWQGMALLPLVPFLLVLLTATIPITMPAAFTIANAIEAQELAKEGVLVTELPTIQDAATMNVLCVDKTGTLTQNRQTVVAIVSVLGESEEEILSLASATCDEAAQSPLEHAIFDACEKRSIPYLARKKLIPFDPMKKYSESYINQNGQELKIIMGSPTAIEKLVESQPNTLGEQIDKLASSGARVLAVASGSEQQMTFRGLIALADVPYEDAALLIQALRNLGIRVLMLTGDTLVTARAIGQTIGLGQHFADLNVSLRDPLKYDGFANCYPEDKLTLVKSLQHFGSVGMTGDGINDAPALKQAEVGIAVNTATDVAKAAAKLVLIQPGLQNIVDVVLGGRRVYRRMLTWTITKITRTIELAALLTFGFIATGVFITPLFLIVLIIVMNDIVTMTIATDRAWISPVPVHWNMKEIAKLSTLIALVWIILGFCILWFAFDALKLPIVQIQTLMFVYLIYTAQVTIYLTRVKARFWTFAPSKFFAFATIGNVIVASVLSFCGILMEPIPALFLIATLAVVIATAFLLDEIKIRILKKQ